jgi:hypothetical protein
MCCSWTMHLHIPMIMFCNQTTGKCVKYLPLNEISLIQPMDQSMTGMMKRLYKGNLLQKHKNECNALIFCNHLTVLFMMYQRHVIWLIQPPWSNLGGKLVLALRKKNVSVGFEVLTAVSTKMAVFWVVAQKTAILEESRFWRRWIFNSQVSHHFGWYARLWKCQ